MFSLREPNTKLAFEISELRKKYAEFEAKNIEVEAENTKLKQDKKEVEKTDLIAKLKHDVSLIKEQNLRNKSNGYTSEQILLSQRESDRMILEQVENNSDNTSDTSDVETQRVSVLTEYSDL
ncbi:hypothetical protein Glove_408g20 [Diversispora epigaea]|uniref:Uncharacterized protein n=1 Tax=Diversispora epigaea TaxID=1348612 RepID=A0A397GY96_9GLOM|nr:hypothetical protein Glove_408g20 [Diversispora epigaea]